MVNNLLDRPLVPVANPDNAAETYEELLPYLLDAEIVLPDQEAES